MFPFVSFLSVRYVSLMGKACHVFLVSRHTAVAPALLLDRCLDDTMFLASSVVASSVAKSYVEVKIDGLHVISPVRFGGGGVSVAIVETGTLAVMLAGCLVEEATTSCLAMRDLKVRLYCSQGGHDRVCFSLGLYQQS